eukprot:277394_1
MTHIRLKIKHREYYYRSINNGYIRQIIQPLLNPNYSITIPNEIYSECFKFVHGSFVAELSEIGTNAANYIKKCDEQTLQNIFDTEFVNMIDILWRESAVQYMYEMSAVTG